MRSVFIRQQSSGDGGEMQFILHLHSPMLEARLRSWQTSMFGQLQEEMPAYVR
jgi:hypothetical protein